MKAPKPRHQEVLKGRLGANFSEHPRLKMTNLAHSPTARGRPSTLSPRESEGSHSLAGDQRGVCISHTLPSSSRAGGPRATPEVGKVEPRILSSLKWNYLLVG